MDCRPPHPCSCSGQSCRPARASSLFSLPPLESRHTAELSPALSQGCNNSQGKAGDIKSRELHGGGRGEKWR